MIGLVAEVIVVDSERNCRCRWYNNPNHFHSPELWKTVHSSQMYR